MSSTIKGIVAYPITPFDRDTGAFDPKPLHTLLDSMISSGVDAIAPLGSTGESAYLDDAEWETVARETVDYVDRRVPTRRRSVGSDDGGSTPPSIDRGRRRSRRNDDPPHVRTGIWVSRRFVNTSPRWPIPSTFPR